MLSTLLVPVRCKLSPPRASVLTQLKLPHHPSFPLALCIVRSAVPGRRAHKAKAKLGELSTRRHRSAAHHPKPLAQGRARALAAGELKDPPLPPVSSPLLEDLPAAGSRSSHHAHRPPYGKHEIQAGDNCQKESPRPELHASIARSFSGSTTAGIMQSCTRRAGAHLASPDTALSREDDFAEDSDNPPQWPECDEDEGG